MSAQPNPVSGYPPNYSAIASQTIPEGLDLLQAHVFFRHGERTPVKERLTHLGVPKVWNMCSAGKEFAAGVLNDPDALGKKRGFLRIRTGLEAGQENRPVPGGKDQCSWGQLTDTGRLSTLRLGQELRKLYVGKLGLVPKTLTSTDASLLHLRSTAVPRAIESMQQVLHGFLPQDNLQHIPQILIRTPQDESLYPNTMCPLYRTLDRQYVKSAAEQWDDVLLKPLDKKIADIVGTPVRIQSHPSANGVLDSIRGSQAHGIEVPKVFEDKEVATNLEAAVVHEWFSGYVNKQFTRLSMGRLLGDLSTRFDDSISGSHSPFKLGLYACHDTTVAGILNALKCFDDRWPFFTAYLSFELFRKQGSAKTSNTSGFAWLTSLVGQQGKSDDEVYIRVKYNSKDMHIPACAEQGQHLEGSGGTVCTLSAFKSAIKNVVMTSEEWRKECKQPLGE